MVKPLEKKKRLFDTGHDLGQIFLTSGNTDGLVIGEYRELPTMCLLSF